MQLRREIGDNLTPTFSRAEDDVDQEFRVGSWHLFRSLRELPLYPQPNPQLTLWATNVLLAFASKNQNGISSCGHEAISAWHRSTSPTIAAGASDWHLAGKAAIKNAKSPRR
jgi:hypothetical protein